MKLSADAYFIVGTHAQHSSGPSGDGIMVADEKDRYVSSLTN